VACTEGSRQLILCLVRLLRATMGLLAILLGLVLVLAVATWIAAQAVSAPEGRFRVCLAYAAVDLTVAIAVEAAENAPLPFLAYALGGIAVVLFKFWITMRFFQIGFLKALCLLIVISALSHFALAAVR
jgi:hypothetical protein